MTLDVKYLGASLGCLFGFGLGLTTEPIIDGHSMGATIQTLHTLTLAASFGALGMLGELAFDHLKSTTSLSTVIDVSRVIALGLISVVCSSYLPERIKRDPVAKVIIPTLIGTVCAYSVL